MPLLAVEVLSRSTRAVDTTLKRLVLEEACLLSYWFLDADVPLLTVLELRDGAYAQTAFAEGAQALTVELPADLLR